MHPRPPVLDAIFETPQRRPGLWRALPWLLALGLHLDLIVLAVQKEPSLETWSARVAAELHRSLSQETPVVLEAVPPPAVRPPPQREPSPPKAAVPVARARKAPARSVAPNAPRETSAAEPEAAVEEAAAAAAAVVAADLTTPVDLTAGSFVTGRASRYAGGVTRAGGQARVSRGQGAVSGSAKVPQGASRSLAKRVRLTGRDWQCAWPAAALAQDIYAQSVLVRVTVNAEGGVARVVALSDPGYGFAAAAVACARARRFMPAEDAAGQPVSAVSDPIRVRFKR